MTEVSLKYICFDDVLNLQVGDIGLNDKQKLILQNIS